MNRPPADLVREILDAATTGNLAQAEAAIERDRALARAEVYRKGERAIASLLERLRVQTQLIQQARHFVQDNRDALHAGHSSPTTGEIEIHCQEDRQVAEEVREMDAWLDRAVVEDGQ